MQSCLASRSAALGLIRAPMRARVTDGRVSAGVLGYVLVLERAGLALKGWAGALRAAF